MKVVNPAYRTPTTSDTEAYGCRCRCSTGQAGQFDKGDAYKPGCGCQCDHGTTNLNANFDYAHTRAY